MYTVVPRPEVVEHRPRPGEPALEIIDHREKGPQTRRSQKKRQEQLPYDTLREQRDSLFQKELKYKKRIEDLEKDSKELLKTYESIYEENTKLKRILDSGPDAVKLKQLSKDSKEQKGIIDQLKEENQALAEKLTQLEKEVLAEKLKANERSWDIQLAKVKKKREEEDSIPTEGPFVAGNVAKPKRMTLRDEEGEQEFDAYDLEVDSLEKEAQVLLNKVKLLKREKEQIDFATVMGKGAITKNKTVAKAINEKLNRDLNKFVIRLQMLKMKQNAARTYCNLMTDESNPVIKLKPTDEKSGQATPVAEASSRDGRRSWKKLSNVPTPKSLTEINKGGNSSAMSKPQQATPKPGPAKVGKESERKASTVVSKPNKISRDRRENTPKSPTVNKNGQQGPKQQNRSNSGEDRALLKSSSQIWRKVQSNSKLTVGNMQEDAAMSGDAKTSRRNSSKTNGGNNHKTSTDNLIQSVFENEKDNKNSKASVKKTQPSGVPDNDNKGAKVNNKTKNDVSDSDNKGVKANNKTKKDVPDSDNKAFKANNKTKKDVESTGRYSHGPEPVGRKGLTNKKDTKLEKVTEEPNPGNSPPKVRGILKSAPLSDSMEDLPTRKDHGHGLVYRINAPDDGYNLIRLHNHINKVDRGGRANPVPIKFKTRRTYDVRPGRSIIGNSGIRKDNFYKRLNEDDPYYGL